MCPKYNGCSFARRPCRKITGALQAACYIVLVNSQLLRAKVEQSRTKKLGFFCPEMSLVSDGKLFFSRLEYLNRTLMS